VDITTSAPPLGRPDTAQPIDFDSRPLVPVAEYEHTVKSVNVGYELFFTLSHSFLRSLGRSDLNVSRKAKLDGSALHQAVNW